MIHLYSGKISSKDCKILANLNASVRQGTPLESTKTVDEVARSIEDLSSNDAYQIIAASDENGKLIGWIYYYTAFRLMTFISGFYPVVDKQREEIALALIEASKKETIERGDTRLEIELVFPTEDHRSYSQKIIEWYRKCGFELAAEEVHMRSNLSTIELPKIDQPEGYLVRMFSEFSYDMLEDTGFRTLKNSKEGLFLSMSHDEQKVTLEYFFDKSKQFIEDASLILEREGEIVGFIITRLNDDGEPEIGPVGLVPEARAKGLASYLLVRVLENLKSCGKTSVYLDTTITNHPAQKLYRKYGFQDVYYKQFYYWSP